MSNNTDTQTSLLTTPTKDMTSEVIVNVCPQDISIALLEDKRLVEYQSEKRSESNAVGNIYIAKVKKLLPALNACFVDVGYGKEAFLHYLDLGFHFNTALQYENSIAKGNYRPLETVKLKQEPDLPKSGKISDVLQAGSEILVQISKEPISTKGPRLCGELSFAGRNVVLIPFGDKVSVSSKIKSDAERARLKQLVYSIKPKNFGVIIRTVAEGKRASELDSEIKGLLKRAHDAFRKASNTLKRPTLVYEEIGRAAALLRDMYNPTFESVYVNDKEIADQISDYLHLIAPESQGIVKEYSGSIPIFDNFGVTKQIKSAFGRTVTYKHGAYLIIEHTEALHVVDVNSGNRSKNPDGQEANALEVNLGAAEELARQLRLRDMGGIIVVDFIDMTLAEDRQKLYERMTQAMQKDRARHNILPLSKFGLMQITRQRTRPATEVAVEETCPTCGGTGKIKSSLLFADILDRRVRELYDSGVSKFTLRVHPYVYAYISSGLFSIKLKWKLRYKFGVRVIPDQSLPFLEYKFVDSKGEEISMKEKHEMK